MPLDPNTQYFAMGGSNAGAQPADTSSLLGIDPELDLQSAGAQAAPAAGQGLAALLQLVQHLTTPQQNSNPSQQATPSPALPPSAMSAGGTDGAAAGSPQPGAAALSGALGALAGMSLPAPSASPAPMVPMAAPAQGADASSAAPAPASSPIETLRAIINAVPSPSSPASAASVPDGSVGMAPPPGQSPDAGMQYAGPQAQAPNSGGAASPLTMPTMPKHNNVVLQALGALSALAGGPGGRIASQIIANQKTNDTDRYNQQVQAYGQQQKDVQQATDNQYQQADNASKFTEQLAKMDPATQEQTVRNLTSAQMAANGFTADQVQKQFFGPDGKFLPVSAADKPTNPVALARAQTAARAALSQQSPTDQQAQHDAYANNPDEWVQQTGMPYDSFTPITTTKDANAAATLAERTANDQAASGAKTSDAQNSNMKTFLSMSPALQKVTLDSYATHPQDAEAKYGVPFSGMKVGMTQANATAAQATANKEADAKRTAQVQTLGKQQQAQYQNRMVALKAEGLNIEQAHNVAMEEIGQRNAATSSSRLTLEQNGGGRGIQALRGMTAGAGTVAGYQATINQANTAKNSILKSAHDKDGVQRPLTPDEQSVVNASDQRIIEAQHGIRALSRGVNPVSGQATGYLHDPRTGRPLQAPDGSFVRPLAPAPVTLPAGPRSPALTRFRAMLPGAGTKSPSARSAPKAAGRLDLSKFMP